MVLLCKEAGEPRRRHIGCNRFRIASLAGESDRLLVDIGGENLQLDVPFRRRDLLEKEHGERIGLLAGAAAGNPDPQRPVQGVPVDEIGYDLVRQEFEGTRVAEEAGDVDQQVLGEELELTWILPQPVEIPTTVIGTGQRHAPLDPPQQCARLVEREIVRGFRAQKIDDLGEEIRGMIVRHRAFTRTVEHQLPTVVGEHFRKSSRPEARGPRRPSKSRSAACRHTRPRPDPAR